MKTLRLVFSFCLLLSILLAAYAPGAVLAQDQPPEKPPEKIEVLPVYPRVEAIAGGTFDFEVELRYIGEQPKVFDLQVTGPKGWEVYMTPQYEKEKKISAIRLEPAFTMGTKIRAVAQAPFFPLPDPGQYKITLNAASGQLKGSAELTAIITVKYVLYTVPALERYNTTAQSGKDNFFSIKIQNLGTAPIENVKFSTTKPEGWTIEFKPDKIESLKAIDEQTIDVNIKPAPKTIAGDYLISISASGTQTSAQKMDIRVTVESPSIWGWVGVGIILVVVLGVIGIFMRFSRR